MARANIITDGVVRFPVDITSDEFHPIMEEFKLYDDLVSFAASLERPKLTDVYIIDTVNKLLDSLYGFGTRIARLARNKVMEKATPESWEELRDALSK